MRATSGVIYFVSIKANILHNFLEENLISPLIVLVSDTDTGGYIGNKERISQISITW